MVARTAPVRHFLCGAVVVSAALAAAFGADQRPRVLAIVGLAVTGLLVSSALAGPSAPRLSADTEIATAGYFRLTWTSGTEPFELQEASVPDFRNPDTVYRGPDRASVISGKPDGILYYRVRSVASSQPGAWSDAVTVTVAHHDLSRALMFLGLGVIVFIAIVVMVVRGKRIE